MWFGFDIVPLAFAVAVLYLLVSNRALKRRLSDLENRMLRAQDSSQVEAEAEVAAAEHTARENITDKEIAAAAHAKDIWSRKSPPSEGPEQPSKADALPKSVVFNREKAAALFAWLKENWFYAVSALSLALAGVFLVQYGNEQGLLPPIARVWAAIGFGVALIAAGEYLRRRFGDEAGAATAYLPSTFSGAGVVSLFAGVLSARLLYALISPEFTLIALVAIAILAIALGWFYGSFLAAVGLIGAMSAPFLVGGDSDTPEMLYGYFALVAVAGLLIDAIRRWAWVSALSLILAVLAGGLLYAGGGDGAGLVLMGAALALAAIALPVLKLVPNHNGSMSVQSLPALRAKLGLVHAPWPEFPTFLAAGMMLAASGLAVFVALDTPSSSTSLVFWPLLGLLCLLFAAISLWAVKASALADLALLPFVALLAIIVLEADNGRIWSSFQAAAERLPEAPFPWAVSAITALGGLLTLFAVWRSFRDVSWPKYWGILAIFIAPAVLVLLEIFWQPAAVIGAYTWAWHAAALAIVMMLLAVRYARRDGADRLRSAMAMLASLSMISFGCMVLLSTTALTLSLALTVLAAAALDRRFNLPLLALFIQAGIVVIGYRLLLNPGLIWASDAPVPAVFLAFGGSIIAFVATYVVLAGLNRPATKTMLESAIFANTGVMASVLLTRWLHNFEAPETLVSNWAFSLNALIWICVSYAQFYRLRSGGSLAVVRKILGTLFGVMAAALLLISVTVANPLLGFVGDVIGPVMLNTLLVAYLLPALLLAWGAKYLWAHRRKTALALNIVAGGLAVLYIGLAIRHFWRGPDLSHSNVTQPELYSYTVALLIAGALLLYQSIARRSANLRKAAMTVIALTVIKVFFVDISGLAGLTRVFSLLALGLSLAGLAWLNRWASGKSVEVGDEVGDTGPEAPEPEPTQPAPPRLEDD